jgi:sec-independent protein translocase protein TatA
MPGYGELILIGLVLLLLFGRRVPEVMRTIGKGVTHFRRGLRDIEADVRAEMEAEETKTLPQGVAAGPHDGLPAPSEAGEGATPPAEGRAEVTDGPGDPQTGSGSRPELVEGRDDGRRPAGESAADEDAVEGV